MDKLPPNFCFSPWTNLDINPDGAMRPCCKYDFYDNPNNLYTTTIEEYKNSEFLVNLKKDFLNGIRNEGCARCWKEEKQKLLKASILSLSLIETCITRLTRYGYRYFQSRNQSACGLQKNQRRRHFLTIRF